MKRARDKDGKFSKIYGEEKVSEPTAADLDKHQADVEAENQARMDTEKKQAVAEGMTLDEGDRAWIRKTVNEKVIQELGIPAPPYGGIALFAASMAILAVLGTLWAVYYVVRPKLDNFQVYVGVQPASFCPEGWSCQTPPFKREEFKPETEVPQPIVDITTLDHVYLIIKLNQDPSYTVDAPAGWHTSRLINEGDVLKIRAGKAEALKVKFEGKEIHPENLYRGGGSLADYVFSGKELLAGK